jgi:hypothetical protein
MSSTSKPSQRLQAIDALLYLIAGSAMVIISVTFLRWLRF